MGANVVKQTIVNAQASLNSRQLSEQVSFFDTSGNPLFMVSALPTPANQLPDRLHGRCEQAQRSGH